MSMVAKSPLMEKKSQQNRFIFYNPDRWKSISVDGHSVGPMGILSLPYSDDSRIASFRERGQLISLPLDYADVAVEQTGAILLRLFEEKGCRGTIVVSRTYAHGDIFLAAEVLEPLLKRYPDNQVIFHVGQGLAQGFRA